MRLSEQADFARIAINRGGCGGARTEIAQLCEAHPDDSSLYAFHCLCTLWCGDHEGAKSAIEERRLIGEHPSMLGVEAEYELLQGNQEQVRRLVDRAKDLDADDYFVLRAEHSLASVQKDTDLGDFTLGRLLELFPNDPTIYAMQVTALQIKGRLDELQKLLDTAPDWFKETAQYHGSRGRLAFTRHQLGEMEEAFQAAVAMMPEETMNWSYLAQAQVHQGNIAEAKRSATYAIEINPRNPLALRVLSRVAEKEGNRDEAREYARRADTAVPAMRMTGLSEEAGALLKRGNIDGALRLFRRQAAGDNAITATSARRMILGILVSNERWKEAQAELAEIDAREDPHPSVDVQRCLIQLHVGEKDAAVATARRILEPQKVTAESYPTALKVFLAAGATEDSVALTQQIMNEPPENPSAIVKCIVVLEKAGRKEEARELHRISSRRYPNVELFRVVEAGFAAEDGDLEKSMRLMSQLPPGSRPRVGILKLLWFIARGLFGRKRKKKD